jgi:hypothetical protein
MPANHAALKAALRAWETWADFDDEGEPTGYTIIGDLDADRAVFCSVGATPEEVLLVARLPEIHALLAEATRLMPGGMAAREAWKARVAALLATVAER